MPQGIQLGLEIVLGIEVREAHTDRVDAGKLGSIHDAKVDLESSMRVKDPVRVRGAGATPTTALTLTSCRRCGGCIWD